ncbi:hypothetical protein OROHE_014873 [Orobanche hederae]
MGQQSLIYSFVARGTVILAEFTEFSGNFIGIAAQCLQKLPTTNYKFTYKCDGHTFNYLVEDGFSAIDPRTRMILNKMHNRGEYSNINGCISTGKEANVYHATKSDGQELAIKIYKTFVLVFKYVHQHFSFFQRPYVVTVLYHIWRHL